MRDADNCKTNRGRETNYVVNYRVDATWEQMLWIYVLDNDDVYVLRDVFCSAREAAISTSNALT